jgi:hypothetical protein
MANDTAVRSAEGDEAAITALRADNQRLQETIQQLAQERDRDRQTIASLSAERDAYRRVVYAWALDRITDEDLERYAQQETSVPLAEFIGELEQPARVSKDA